MISDIPLCGVAVSSSGQANSFFKVNFYMKKQVKLSCASLLTKASSLNFPKVT